MQNDRELVALPFYVVRTAFYLPVLGAGKSGFGFSRDLIFGNRVKISISANPYWEISQLCKALVGFFLVFTATGKNLKYTWFINFGTHCIYIYIFMCVKNVNNLKYQIIIDAASPFYSIFSNYDFCEYLSISYIYVKCTSVWTNLLQSTSFLSIFPTDVRRTRWPFPFS